MLLSVRNVGAATEGTGCSCVHGVIQGTARQYTLRFLSGGVVSA